MRYFCLSIMCKKEIEKRRSRKERRREKEKRKYVKRKSNNKTQIEQYKFLILSYDL